MTRGPRASEPCVQRRVFAFIRNLFGGLIFTGGTVALPQLLAERLPAS